MEDRSRFKQALDEAVSYHRPQVVVASIANRLYRRLLVGISRSPHLGYQFVHHAKGATREAISDILHLKRRSGGRKSGTMEFGHSSAVPTGLDEKSNPRPQY